MLYQTSNFALFATKENCHPISFLIFIKQHEQCYQQNYFQVWEFNRHNQTSTFDVMVADGNRNLIERLKINLAMVAFRELKIWCVDSVIMFPEDY